MTDLYHEIILEHHRRPRHRAAGLDGCNVHVHHTNPLCGDELDLRLRVEDGTVAEVAFDGQGCAISMASASAMTEAVLGRDLGDADELAEVFRRMLHGQGVERDEDLGDAVAFEGVAQFPVRVKCALLGWMALRDAVTTVAAEVAAHTSPDGVAPSR